MKRSGSLAAVAGLACVLLVGMPTTAIGMPPQTNRNPYTSNTGPGRNKGVVAGSVLSVDYGRGFIVVASNRGRVRITVLPTTGIFNGSKGYASLSDIRSGTRVEVSVSEIDGELVAQIIRIK